MSRKCTQRITRSSLAVALSCFACVAVQAATATMPYGDFTGATVDFLDVRESSSDPLPLFGAPTVQGNNLVFTPENFEAKAENEDADHTDSQVNFTLMAHPGFIITGISVTEFGDYTLSGDDVFVGVGATGFARIGGLVVAQGMDTFSDGTEVDLATPWDLDFSLALNTTEKVDFVMDNSMVAVAGAVDIATIRKKGATITIQTVPVPEPASGLLGLCGVGLAMLLRPRSRQIAA